MVYQPVGLALPGWNAYVGSTELSEIPQNIYTTGAGSVDIFGPNYAAASTQQGVSPGIISGDYTIMLQAGPPAVGNGNATIEQNGTVPANAESIEWKEWNQAPNGAPVSVSFDGNSLSPVVLGAGGNF